MISAGVSRISKMRPADAAARWLMIMKNPSMRNGAWSSST